MSQTDEDVGRQAETGAQPRYTRRLSDKILIAFHHACDENEFETAEQLLHVLEMILTRRPLTPDGNRRRDNPAGICRRSPAHDYEPVVHRRDA